MRKKVAPRGVLEEQINAMFSMITINALGTKAIHFSVDITR